MLLSSTEAEKSADTANLEALGTEKTYLINHIEFLIDEIADIELKLKDETLPSDVREALEKQLAQDQSDLSNEQLKLDQDNLAIPALESKIADENNLLDELRRTEAEKTQEKKDQEAYINNTFPDPPSDQTAIIKELEARLNELLSEGASKELIDEAIEELNAVSPTTYNEAKAKYDAAILERDNLLEKTDPMLNYDYQAALNACKSAEDAYYAALASLDQKQASDWKSQAATGVDLNATMQELDVAKKKLAELTGTDGENITAKVAGTVTSVECNAGDKKMKDDVLCTIEVPDQGYTLSFTATNEQASRLRIGDQATVSNFYWGNEVTATLSSIKTDPKNPQNNKLLTFDLEGNVTSGSQLTISVGSKSANYDLIIPSSAIRSDSNGSFVLKVEAKNSPLGNRYIAKRVPVEVLASDDNNSAVTAELQYGDYVITTSSAPIKNGSMVRLANAS